jgi:hypothetical protein
MHPLVQSKTKSNEVRALKRITVVLPVLLLTHAIAIGTALQHNLCLKRGKYEILDEVEFEGSGVVGCLPAYIATLISLGGHVEKYLTESEETSSFLCIFRFLFIKIFLNELLSALSFTLANNNFSIFLISLCLLLVIILG